jgi:hypothetical protein
MSFVSELKKVGLAQIPDRLELYDRLISEAVPIFELKGKSLEDANKEHAQNLYAYDLMLQEAKTIEGYLKGKLEEIEATRYKHYTESSARAMNATDLKMYVRSDPQYVEANQIMLDVAHTRNQLEALVEALKSMGWSLNNIVKLRVAQLDHIVL